MVVQKQRRVPAEVGEREPAASPRSIRSSSLGVALALAACLQLTHSTRIC
jgi:hypothetical protein